MHAHKNQRGKKSNDKAKVKTRGKQKDKGPNYSNTTISHCISWQYLLPAQEGKQC